MNSLKFISCKNINITTMFFRLYFILLIFTQCTPDSLQLLSSKTGQTINSDRSISNTELTYKFKRYPKKNKVKDLFNYLYFEGDNLFFNFKLNKTIKPGSIKVWFINPKNNDAFPAERIILTDSTVAGFSLIGSIMENFYRDKLDEAIPETAFCCRDIPFVIKVELTDKTKKITHKIKTTFKIIYIDP